MRFAGKCAIVTGAGQGIGAAIAIRLAREGARVAMLDLHAENAEETKSRLEQPETHLALKVNIAKSSEVISAMRTARKVFGRLDFAINNAGIGQAEGDGSDKFYAAMNTRNAEISAGKQPKTHVDHLIHMEDEGWAGVLSVNLNGAFYVCRELVRILAQDNQTGGAIVNISSTSAQSGEGSPHYVTSKSALIGLTRQLARELATRQIRVNALAPGPTQTPIMNGLPQEWIDSMTASVPLGHMADPSDIAAACSYLLSDDARFVTGSVLVANGGSYYF